ncbi:hypothetical protein FH972_007444 [Carpinus fangiana]|uniref:F-box associated domain-containing protein n=1 Tax=Carpinus fangiana TaxID=176857 RepID=A0A5N6QYC6_9ROSI|nr:hypothetical protein FH972_007444 [Carpinus fangiana]
MPKLQYRFAQSMHGVVAARDVYCGSVLAFDLRDQVFREMILNNMIRLRRPLDEVDTCICRGSLALLHYYINEDPERVRPRERYGVVDSWVKQFTVEIDRFNVRGFTKNCHPISTIQSMHGVVAARAVYCGSVLAFDLRDQVFREMIPNNMIRLRRPLDGVHACICRGSLALLHYYINGVPAWPRERYCCIWVMKEYGVVDSWVKQFTVEIDRFNVRGFTKNCHPISTIRRADCLGWELSSYDPQNQKATKLGIHGVFREDIICVDA